MKYAILHGDYNIYHADFESYKEAKEYYDELVEEEGWLNDLKLCKILESHDSPEREHEPLTNGRHWNVDTRAISIDNIDARKIKTSEPSDEDFRKLSKPFYPWF